MSRVATVARTVPQGAWTAVCALVLIASLGFAVVLGAGLSVWTGAIASRARPVSPVVAPPGSGLVVVPGAHPAVRHQATTTGAPPRVSIRPFIRPVAAAPATGTVKATRTPHKPTAVPAPPQPQPVPPAGHTPPPVVLPTQILVLLEKHDLVEKVAHALKDAVETDTDVADDQEKLVDALAKAVTNGDATVVSPAQSTLRSPASEPTVDGDDDAGEAPATDMDADLNVVALTVSTPPDIQAVAVLGGQPPAASQPVVSAGDVATTTPAPSAPLSPASSGPQPAGPVQPAPAAHPKPHQPNAHDATTHQQRPEHHPKHAGGRHRR